jgi:CRISPR-associated endonuclease/helicase Cas3
VAEGWFAANKKHGLLASYGVGTIDQALLAVLQTKHVFVRLFGLAGKCVILDEVHAYDAYMTTLMERLLEWLAALGCPVVLLSATLPRDKRLRLLRAYAGRELPEPEDKPYPRVTSVAAGGVPAVRHFDPTRARTIRLGWLDEGGLVNTLRQALVDGGCAAVVRNTVRLAQKTFSELKKELKADGIRVELFHARFPFGRRMEIEDAVLKRFGKQGGPAGRDKCVLVATQVIEQSLDLDFDLMVSDVAPVDLVLQRAGRLHRHDRGLRPAGVAEPQVWLIEPEIKDALPDFGPSEYVYARFILLRSYVACKAVETVRLPDDLERSVERVYGAEPLAIPDGWQTTLDEAGQALSDEQRNQRRKAKGLMIYRPDDEDLLRQQNAQLDEDNPEAAEKIRAATRDTEPTIQVVLVYHIDGRDYLDNAARESFSEGDEPDIRRVRRLLDNEVTMNHRGCVVFYAGRPVPRGWREKGMLRHHRIARFDASGNSLPTEYPLRFDPDIGVLFTRATDEREGG